VPGGKESWTRKTGFDVEKEIRKGEKGFAIKYDKLLHPSQRGERPVAKFEKSAPLKTEGERGQPVLVQDCAPGAAGKKVTHDRKKNFGVFGTGCDRTIYWRGKTGHRISGPTAGSKRRQVMAANREIRGESSAYPAPKGVTFGRKRNIS